MMGVLKKIKGREIGLVQRVKKRRRRERPRRKKRGGSRGEDWEEVSGPLVGGGEERDQKEEKMRTGADGGWCGSNEEILLQNEGA